MIALSTNVYFSSVKAFLEDYHNNYFTLLVIPYKTRKNHEVYNFAACIKGVNKSIYIQTRDANTFYGSQEVFVECEEDYDDYQKMVEVFTKKIQDFRQLSGEFTLLGLSAPNGLNKPALRLKYPDKKGAVPWNLEDFEKSTGAIIFRVNMGYVIMEGEGEDPATENIIGLKFGMGKMKWDPNRIRAKKRKSPSESDGAKRVKAETVSVEPKDEPVSVEPKEELAVVA